MQRREAMELLAGEFIRWQTPYGRLDPKVCPFVDTSTLVSSMNFHAPTFLAIALYKAAARLGRPEWKAAADRYVVGYLACLREPQSEPDFYTQTWTAHMDEKHGPDADRTAWALHILTWPFIYGMALAAYRHFRVHNPGELALESKASALYEWLQFYRWDEGSYYRNGYGLPKAGIVDCGNSDDNCHIGRGLIAYHAVTRRADVLRDAAGLARYYLTDCVPGTYQGVWNPREGTWVIGPTAADGIEHLTATKSSEASWGFTNTGAIEFLTELAAVTTDEALRAEIAAKCAAAMRWSFDACQFEDGAIGLGGRDDKWLGMTAGAVMSFLRTREAGFLSPEIEAASAPRAQRAAAWLLEHTDPDSVAAGGYVPVTGRTELRPPDNGAWMLGLTLEGLTMLDDLGGGD
jgi:hypothetical protein